MQSEIEKLFESKSDLNDVLHGPLLKDFVEALNRGEIRSAEPSSENKSGWKVNPWVKKGILLLFRFGKITELDSSKQGQQFFDKDSLPLINLNSDQGIRIVPGGSSIRSGVYIGKNVICMPPMFINIGAYVGANSMIDSHSLVGSCAQIGSNVHLSAASQVGGVLEPIGSIPVIIEDDVLVGGNCGIYEGVMLKKGCVLGSGTILNRSTPVYDLVTGEIHRASDDEPLVVPAGAVIVPGSRPASGEHGVKWGISMSTPVIVKYRDGKTDARVSLEDYLR